MNRKELLKKAKEGKIILLDVRPNDEYDSGHIPYAVSIPILEIPRRIDELPKDKKIVAYCRGYFEKERI